MSFVHLHVHSEYSLLESSLRVKSMVKKAAQMQMPAVALTDNGNMFGATEFYFSALKENIKPILGLEVYLTANSRHQKSADQLQKPLTRLVLLAKNIEGYRELCKLSSMGYQEGFYYKPRIDWEVLKTINQNLICLSGGIKGEVAQSFLLSGEDEARKKIKALQEIFKDRFYLELNRTGLSDWDLLIPFMKKASHEFSVPLVAANDVHYLQRDDQIAQEVLICIGTNKTLQDESRLKLGSDQFYFKSAEQMKELFKDIPEAITNTLEIANLCDVKFKTKDENGKSIYHLPSYPTTQSSLKEEIRKLSFEGFKIRVEEFKIDVEKIERYHQRLDYELSVIDKMGFNGYFLIVQDFINWAKNQNIPVGPGRGSGAGSLVAFSLRITDLDPLAHNLLFERFLNPERISMPDFDIDFCQDRRGDVIKYVTEKYGEKSVSQIITFGKLQCRAAIKDVGRVLGMTFAEVDIVTKLVPEKLNITISEALDTEPRLREMMEFNPQVATLIDLASKVEGMVRHAGIHAAGVIIADGELIQHAPLYKGTEGENVVQYDMKHAEMIGLIKFDFLGLKTLTHIQNALNLIKSNRNVLIKSHEISMSDEGIYNLMSAGDTAGVFQFEGDGITDAIRKIKPTCFADITAINALYRPGPMAMIPEYTKRKHGESPVEYIFEELKESLEETKGIIVYQEQVMDIASRIAGYSLGEADMLRRAMGKKIKAEMDQHQKRFLEGALKKGFDEKKSVELFDLMYKFADYGFNKSHAAAYCVLAAQTAWLKNYYPAEFFAALLSTEVSDTDKVVRYVKDAQKRRLVVRPPHINHSEFNFTVKGEEIYFGLGAIKGLGEAAIEGIVQARNKLASKKFESLEQFFEVVEARCLNKKVLEALIKAGALDGFNYHRSQLMHGYGKFLERSQEQRIERELGQGSLFQMDESLKSVVLEKTTPWKRAEELAFEKEVLGFYLSDHPLKGLDHLVKKWVSHKLGELLKVEIAPKEKKRVLVHGIVAELREVITKKGTRMAFGKFEDLSDTCELIVFPDVFSKNESLLKSEKPLLLGGNLEVEGSLAKVIVDTVTLLEETWLNSKSLRVRLEKVKQAEFATLNSIFKEHPGSAMVHFSLLLPEQNKELEMEPEEKIKVALNHDFFENVQKHLGRTDFLELGSG